MNLLERLEYWGDRHHPRWMDIVRIALGIFLCYKAVDFLNNMSDLISLMSSQTSFAFFVYVLAGHYVVFAHLLGGVFLVFGVLTRFACLIQIPVMLGALFFVQSNHDMLRPYSEIGITLLVLLLLVYFLIAGNGPWSVKMREESKKA
jgi:putative oxidoreductase